MIHTYKYYMILLFLLAQTAIFARTAVTERSADTARMVPVAYGNQKEYEISSSVSTVWGSELKNYSVQTMANALYGLLPGLIIKEKTGEVGSYSPDLYVRGRSTFGKASDAPLVFIDGFERNINNIKLEDIESISVMKDAAATAMYGIRAANGVIMVTTRRGAPGRMKIELDLDMGLQNPTRIPAFVSSADYVKMYNQALTNDGLAPKYSASDIAGYEAGNSIYYPDNRWEDELIGNVALSTDANLSASGGNSVARYYVSLGYIHNTGVFKGTDNDDYSTNARLDKFTFRTNLDVTALKNLDINLDVAGQIDRRNMPRKNTSDIWNNIYKYPQHEFPMYVNGLLGGTPIYNENPVGFLNHSGYRKLHDRFYQTTLGAQYNFRDILDGLTIGARYAYDNDYSVIEYYTKTFATYDIIGKDTNGNPVLSMIGKDGNLTYSLSSDAQTRRTNFEAFLKYDREFAGGHSIQSVILYHQDKRVIDKVNPYANQYISGRINYGYDRKYLASLVMSYSGTEAFAPDERFVFYPALSAAWILSEENFLKGVEAINFLKLRMSAGWTGNGNVGERLGYRQLYVSPTDVYYFGTAPTNKRGRTEGMLANPNLAPEKSFKFDAGADIQVFNSISLAATYFYEKRTDILTSLSNTTSSIIGATMPNINNGATRSTGIEGSVWWNKSYRDLAFNIGLNFTWYTNEILKLLQEPVPAGSEYQYKEGTRIGQEYGLVFDGFFNSDLDIANSPTQQYGPVSPGDIRYKDMNQDGLINDYDRVLLDGNPVPDVDLGLNLNVSYKGFDISALIHAQMGSDIYLGDSQFLFWPLYNNGARIATYVADHNPWTAENAAYAGYPRLTTMENPNNYRRSDFWTINGNRLRFRKIELGYTLPDKVSRKLAMSGFRIYLRGTNLFTLDHLKFVDPVGMGSNPFMRSLHLGVNVSF